MDEKVSDEAHYWFTVQDFAYLSVHNGLDKMIEDVLQCRRKILADKQDKQVNHITDCEF